MIHIAIRYVGGILNMNNTEHKILNLFKMIMDCNNIVFFGGAGVSTESGVKDYRSENGLYNIVQEYGFPPEIILSRTFFYDHPDIFYDFYRKYFINDVLPNDSHKALAYLESCGRVKSVITQNIDGLHQAAGSRNVIELHGTSKDFYCPKCNYKNINNTGIIDIIKNGDLPLCTCCKTIVKPKVVLYEEPLYEGVAEQAVDKIRNADMLIVGGTSLAVYPAASFVDYFEGKYIVIINKSSTFFDKKTDLVINESIGMVFSKIINLMN